MADIKWQKHLPLRFAKEMKIIALEFQHIEINTSFSVKIVQLAKIKAITPTSFPGSLVLPSPGGGKMRDPGKLIFWPTLFFYKNVVFPAQVEYSYFFANFRAKIFLYYSEIIAYDIFVLECVWYLDLCRVVIIPFGLLCWILYICITCTIHWTVISVEHFAVADPDLELRGGGGGGLDLLALSAIFPSVISSFFTQNKGGPGPPGPLP